MIHTSHLEPDCRSTGLIHSRSPPAVRVFGCSDQWDGDKAFRAVPCLGTAARPGFWRAIKIPPVTSVSTSLLTPWTPSTARCGREARMTEAESKRLGHGGGQDADQR
ncbi:unnamed protein product [Durusdinium trenchii]|uniref:Uncharacterized protein n=2 Tax=Durusdinium trenchii TaxID=1381693 RepID=A0ABP0P0M4_9DINO